MDVIGAGAVSQSATSAKSVTIIAAGDCSYDAGPGGYGVVLLYRGTQRLFRKELSGGFSKTMPRRLALAGAIAGLEVLKEPCIVQLYIVQAPWHGLYDVRPEHEEDLVQRIGLRGRNHLQLRRYDVERYDDRHEGQRCQQLAQRARMAGSLPPDPGYQDALRRGDQSKGAQEQTRQAETLAPNRAHDQARREQEAELALPEHIRSLRRQVRELSAMVGSKREQLYADTMDDRAHDRLYETLQREEERLGKLQRALAEAGREVTH